MLELAFIPTIGLMKRIPRFRLRPDAKGELNPSAKLSALAVREIRDRADRGEAYSSIAKAYGVNETTVSRIHRGLKWK